MIFATADMIKNDLISVVNIVIFTIVPKLYVSVNKLIRDILFCLNNTRCICFFSGKMNATVKEETGD